MRISEATRIFKKSDILEVEHECDEYIWFLPNVKSKDTITINGHTFKYDFNGGLVIDKEFDAISIPVGQLFGIGVMPIKVKISEIVSLELE